MQNIEVSIIIVNYNTKTMTKDCIESVIKHTQSNTFEIIVVDNSSVDGSKEIFTGDNRIRYIYSDLNLGFGRANNMGIEIAMGKYLFLLNSDTILLSDVIKKLYDFSELKIVQNLYAVGTCLIDNQNKDALSFGQFLTPRRTYRKMLEHFGYYKTSVEEETYKEIKDFGYAEVDYISGADLFLPKKIFESIEPFDPDYFMYYEETDLEKRMDNHGIKRYILNVRDIIHLEGGSFGHSLPFSRKLMMTRGMMLYIKKHFKALQKIHVIFLSLLVLLKDLKNLKYSRTHNVTIIKEIFK